jgi:biotin carboxylase
MHRLLLIAPETSYRTASYLVAAHDVGLDVWLAAHGPTMPSHPGLSQGIHIDLREPDAALETIVVAVDARGGVDGVVATDDSTVELAARVAAVLGLPHNPVSAAACSRRKDLARARLQRAGLPVPAYRCLNLNQPLGVQLVGQHYPCVIKPVAFSASRGVIRADSEEELWAACARVQAMLGDAECPEERETLLVEDYIPGEEIAVEAILHRGALTILTVFDKPDPLEGPYFEETYYITPARVAPDVQARVAERVAQACAAYGLTEGPVHAELRLYGGEAWILEVASRTIGGQCARLLRFGTGYTLEQLVLAQAIGQPLAPEPQQEAGGVLMIPILKTGILRRVEGVMAAMRVPYIEDLEISLREGYRLVPLPEGNRYLGFIFARAPSSQEAEHALRTAHACLNVVVAPLFELSDARACPPRSA